MKRLFLIAGIMGMGGSGIGQPGPNFSGLWKTDHGVLVHFEHKGSGLLARYISPGDCVTGHNCILDSDPEFFVKGTVSGKKMDLLMMRCTHDSAMRADNLSDHYTRPCKIEEFNDEIISGTYRTEYYDVEVNDGKKHFIRNDSGDRDQPFSVYRTSCKKELEKLVEDLERKRESLEQSRSAIEDVSRSSDQAIEGWHQEWQEQLTEDAFHLVVPPQVKVVPGAFDQDAGSYISSWVDFLSEIAEKGGHWAGEKATKIIGLWDLIIDWGNVVAKGKQTINEVNQMNEGLRKMNQSELENFLSYIIDLKAYEALSKYCEKEIPVEDQPKLKKRENKDAEEMGKSREEANRILGSISLNLQSASNELTKTRNALNKLETLLKPHQAADSSKTMLEVLKASGIKKLKDSLIEAGTHWKEVFKHLQQVRENRKNLDHVIGR